MVLFEKSYAVRGTLGSRRIHRMALPPQGSPLPVEEEHGDADEGGIGVNQQEVREPEEFLAVEVAL